jgi:hypothetical protein
LISGTVSAGQGQSGAFLESGGLVVIQAESGNLVPNWGTTTAAGATGIIGGSNHFNSQNGGTIPYQVTITTPGVYRLNWRTFYSGPLASEENDSWLRFANNDNVWFFAIDNSAGDVSSEANIIANLLGEQDELVFPVGSGRESAGTPNGASSNGYFKVYRSGGTAEVYNWQAFVSDNDNHNIHIWFVNPGTYTMEVSERSLGHAIDKIALYKVDGPAYTSAQLTALPESARSNGTLGAAANSPYTVTVTATDTGIPALADSEVFSWVIGQGSSGSGNGVASLTLINADTDTDLFNLSNGMQIEPATVQGTTLAIRANTNPAVVGSVLLTLSGPVTASRNENVAPYSLFGDNSGNYSGNLFPVGSYTASATAFSGSGQSGTNLGTLTINFSVGAGGTSKITPATGEAGLPFVEISLYPNPSDTYSDVATKNMTEAIQQILVFDVTGRLVRQYDAGMQLTGEGTYRIQVQDLEEGTYFVKFITEGARNYYKQLVVKKL